MSSFAKLAAAAVAVVAVVAIGWALYANNQGIGTQPTATPALTPEPSPSPSPTVAPTGLALTQSFTSAIYGMSVGYPAGSIVVPASGPWTARLPGVDDAPSRDTIWIDQDANLFIGLASQPLAGRSGDEWIAEISELPDWDDSCDAADNEPVTVDGASGIVTLCSERPLNALVVDDERGYFIVSTVRRTGTSSNRFWRQFSSIRRPPPTLQLRPPTEPGIASTRSLPTGRQASPFLRMPPADPCPVQP